MEPLRCFIGFEPREADAYAVAAASLRRHASRSVEVKPIVLADMRARGLYARPTDKRNGQLWDVISDAPMSTEFALTRFLVPELAGWKGWALFCDCDFLFRADVAEVFDCAHESLAVMVVPHFHVPSEAVKMDGQKQTNYTRKNWSSFMLFNAGHLAHAGQIDRVHRWPGLWLHQFRWLQPGDIGALPVRWNWLEGVSDSRIEPSAVHYTRGVPSMAGFENAAFADEWRTYARR